MPAIFTERAHPELLHVALKGEMLREFVLHLWETIELDEKAFAKIDDSDPGKQTSLDILAIEKQVALDITKNLGSDEARQYGIDADNLRALISNAAHVDVHKIHFAGAMEKTVSAITAESSGLRNSYLNEAAVSMAAITLMEIFCLCLAVQEGREKDYLPLADETMKEERAWADSLTPPLANAPPAVIKEIQRQSIEDLAHPVVIYSYLLDSMRQRHSPLVGLLQQTIYGDSQGTKEPKNGLLVHVKASAAQAFGLDLAKNADREKLRRTLRDACKTMAEKMELPIPKEMEI